MMGVPWSDCTIVAELIGIKTVLNEFVAYTDLATYISNRNNGTEPYISVGFNMFYLSLSTSGHLHRG